MGECLKRSRFPAFRSDVFCFKDAAWVMDLAIYGPRRSLLRSLTEGTPEGDAALLVRDGGAVVTRKTQRGVLCSIR